MSHSYTPSAPHALPWKRAIALVFLAPFLLYFDTTRSIVSVWNSSETFAHGYIIVPIAMWLIWQRRGVIAKMAPAPYWPFLPVLALCGFAWLLADLSGVQVVRQYALVAMVPVMVMLVLGARISRAIAFPLLFLLLAVPFGEVFIEPLIKITADITVTALQITGIPVYRDGPNFVIPSGNWSVVTACSGVRYLIASFTLGCLYAYLTYRSRVRQAMFILLSIIVPIIANGIRAYMIVMIGHLSGMELAVGVDHLIYGWLFFGIVMLLMFWIGSFWREDVSPSDGKSNSVPATDEVNHPVARTHVVAAVFGAIACLSLWPVYSYYVSLPDEHATPVSLSHFQPTWQEAPAFTQWKPQFFPAKAQLHQFYGQGADAVGLSIHYYRNQHRGSMLISSSNRLVDEEDREWKRLGTSLRSEHISGADIPLREARIEGASGRFLVWTWYWIDGKFIANDYLGKLLQAKEKLLLRGDDGASITLFAQYDENPETARSVMRSFLTSHRAILEQTLNANKHTNRSAY